MNCFRHLRIGSRLLLIAANCAGAVTGVGQSTQGTSGFDVASIRPSSSTDGRALLQATPGRLAMTNLVLRRLILIAYDAQDDQLVGGPGWINSANYDVEAKADGNPSVQQMEGPMLRSLLEERFRLTVHRETRQLAVYKLSISKGGPKLPLSKEGSCIPYVTDSSPPKSSATEPHPNYCGLHAAVNGLDHSLDGKGVTMAALAASLSRAYNAALGRNVIDGTGLAGSYDIHLEWATDPQNPGTDDAGKLAPQGQSEPSIFAALEDQLGLKLEPSRDAVEVFVVDHIEKPSEN